MGSFDLGSPKPEPTALGENQGPIFDIWVITSPPACGCPREGPLGCKRRFKTSVPSQAEQPASQPRLPLKTVRCVITELRVKTLWSSAWVPSVDLSADVVSLSNFRCLLKKKTEQVLDPCVRWWALKHPVGDPILSPFLCATPPPASPIPTCLHPGPLTLLWSLSAYYSA